MSNKITIETNNIGSDQLLEIINSVVSDKLDESVQTSINDYCFQDVVSSELSTWDLSDHLPDSDDIAADLVQDGDIKDYITDAIDNYLERHVIAEVLDAPDRLVELRRKHDEHLKRYDQLVTLVNTVHRLALDATAPRWYHNAWYRMTTPFRVIANYYKGY
jgi:hypothetical protein